MEKITDPLKRIELFKAITSPAYIIASLENTNDVSREELQVHLESISRSKNVSTE